ncbi:MAG: helix-turn-helix domain-containing protein [Chloroflexota bacterium]|nr:helix-turn-helix domain-containing protein [Chloroflexota bacterium]
MCASGELRAVRRGRSVRVSVEEVQRWIREQEQQEIAIK